MIVTESFICGCGDWPPKSSARKEPFPDSSSTPVTNTPDYHTEHTTRPLSPEAKMAERLTAIEHQNETLMQEINGLRAELNRIQKMAENGPDTFRLHAELQKRKREEGVPEELSPKKFHELIKKARVVKPELLTRETASKYPEINNIAKQMTADDFINAAKLWTQEQESLMSRLIGEQIRLTDKACFDCFKEYLDCQKADDVFVIMTSSVLYHHYNEILPLINARIAEYVGGPCMGLGEMTEPAAGSREMLETLRARWDEIYKEDDNESNQSDI